MLTVAAVYIATVTAYIHINYVIHVSLAPFILLNASVGKLPPCAPAAGTVATSRESAEDLRLGKL
jgi:hypothetical protein